MATVKEHGVRTVLEFGDGWRWVFLTTAAALGREFSAMGLDPGVEGYADIRRQGPGCGYRSLRDPQGRPVFAVMAEGKDRLYLKNAVRAEGAKPSEHAIKLVGLMEAESLRLFQLTYPAPFGLARIGGRLTPLNQALDLIRAGTVEEDLDLSGMDCRDLPRKISVKGRLQLRWCMNGDDLPDGMRIGGDLLLEMSHITRTPKDLRVRGMLSLAGCDGLVSITPGLKVGDILELNGCTSLKELPAGLKVGGSLLMSDCTSLETVPEGLRVGRDLTLSDCPSLVTLPEGLSVGGDLTLLKCASLETLPEGLRVGGDLWLFNSKALRSLPEDMEVKGEILGRDDLPRPGAESGHGM